MFLDLTSPMRQCIVRAALSCYAKQQGEVPTDAGAFRKQEATVLLREVDDMLLVSRRQQHPAATHTSNKT